MQIIPTRSLSEILATKADELIAALNSTQEVRRKKKVFGSEVVEHPVTTQASFVRWEYKNGGFAARLWVKKLEGVTVTSADSVYRQLELGEPAYPLTLQQALYLGENTAEFERAYMESRLCVFFGSDADLETLRKAPKGLFVKDDIHRTIMADRGIDVAGIAAASC